MYYRKNIWLFDDWQYIYNFKMNLITSIIISKINKTYEHRISDW